MLNLQCGKEDYRGFIIPLSIAEALSLAPSTREKGIERDTAPSSMLLFYQCMPCMGIEKSLLEAAS